jgi:formylglycine-generating enzyme required for sulfatase activity
VKPDCPVVGVSWEDTHEYARWLTARARASGQRGNFVLASFEERNHAGGDGLRRRFPFGNRFRPKWISSCFARPRANVEPVLRFPIDESPYGVFDLCGSAREWVDDWYDEGRGLRRICGGSWAQADPDAFHFFGHGHGPQVASGDFGFRLVFREDPR